MICAGAMLLGTSNAFPQQGTKPPGRLNDAQKMAMTSLPVMPWLSIKQTHITSAQAKAQTIASSAPGTMNEQSDSIVTGGAAITLALGTSKGLFGEKGFRIMSMAFNPGRTLELVTFMFDRGWNDENIKPLLERVKRKYEIYADPELVMDGESEASDRYYIFDIGRFVVELAVPQYGTFIPVYFTTKDTYRRMRMADSTYHLFAPIIDKV